MMFVSMNLQALWNKADEYSKMKQEIESLAGYILTDEEIIEKLRKQGYSDVVDEVCGKPHKAE